MSLKLKILLDAIDKSGEKMIYNKNWYIIKRGTTQIFWFIPKNDKVAHSNQIYK